MYMLPPLYTVFPVYGLPCMLPPCIRPPLYTTDICYLPGVRDILAYVTHTHTLTHSHTHTLTHSSLSSKEGTPGHEMSRDVEGVVGKAWIGGQAGEFRGFTRGPAGGRSYRPVGRVATGGNGPMN